MKTYDSNQVRDFAEQVHARINDCAHGEGKECDSIDKKLNFVADRCWEFSQELRRWANDIFAGRTAYDAVAERFWKAELYRLIERGNREWISGAQAEEDCFVLDGRAKLGAVLWTLSEMADPWVTPARSVGPAGRERNAFSIPPKDVVERIQAFPQRPKDWMPSDRDQAARFKAVQEG